jgi:hypothetical protein
MCLAIATMLLAGCYQPRDENDEQGIGAPVDLFAPDAGPPPCMTPDPSPLSQLKIRVRTFPYGGQFKPRNVGAIWIERADGSFVKTVERWGQIRAKWLTRFIASSNNNVVDAVTGPTPTVHSTHERTWDLTDLTRCEIPSGNYQVMFELTDRNGPGGVLAVPFTKDQTALSMTPSDAPTFRDLLIELN